ncbi:Pro-Pol polyprotein, partial [Trachymyrmex cornetzi]
VFLIVDAFTKYVKLYATKTTASKEAIKALYDYFINYSKPRIVVSDRGSCFISQEFKQFLDNHSIKHILVATGSPQSNGQEERINRVIVPMLSKQINREKGQSWYNVLHQVEYALNNWRNA